MAKRVILQGNDLYREIIPKNTDKSVKVAYWDLWMAIILVNEFKGNWNRMEKYLRKEDEDHLDGIMNHLRMLRQTLSQAGLSPADILAQADEDFLKKQKTKAKRKILEADFQNKEKSPWMINTPQKQREARAMRGHWDLFPVSPDNYAGLLEKCYKKSGYSEDQSHALESKLSSFIKKHEARASSPQVFALYRAFLTVVIEKMEMVDDSFGTIGDSYKEKLKIYYQLDRSELDMDSSDFFQDFMELLIWEDYGFTCEQMPDLFASLSSSEIPMVESILQDQRKELNELELEYQAEEALTMLGMLYVQNQLFDKFIPAAEIMGTHEWERITTMSEMAEKHKKYDLALAVYEACMGPGDQRDCLREEFNELKKRLRKRK